MSRGSSAARIGAQTTAGGVVVVADSSAIGSSSAWPDRRLDTARIHQDPRDTPQRNRGHRKGSCPTGRITISLTSTPAGWLTAYMTARATSAAASFGSADRK